MTLSRTSVGFGNQVVNTTSGSQSVTVTNSGTAPLQIINVTLNGVPGRDGVREIRRGPAFALDHPPSRSDLSVLRYGDQALPRLPNGGLVRWLATRDQLHDLLHSMGFSRHFLYSSSGPSVGQWWMAHRAGGRLIAGAVHAEDTGDSLGRLHAGEVVELTVRRAQDVLPMLEMLRSALAVDHLAAVPVGRLMHDAGASV